jgi:hypothetical protein
MSGCRPRQAGRHSLRAINQDEQIEGIWCSISDGSGLRGGEGIRHAALGSGQEIIKGSMSERAVALRCAAEIGKKLRHLKGRPIISSQTGL